MAGFLNYTGSGGTDTRLLAAQIPLLIEPLLMRMYPEMDPFFMDVFSTSEGVGRVSEMSRDWKVRKVIERGLTGVVNMATSSTVFGTQREEIGSAGFRIGANTIAGYPSVTDSYTPKPYNLDIGLQGLRASVPWLIDDDDMDANPAIIGSRMTSMLMGFARHICLYAILHFYAEGGGAIATFTFATSGDTYSTPNGTVTITIGDGAINSFVEGMIVDIFEGDNQRNIDSGTIVPLYVETVDRIQGIVILKYIRASLSTSLLQDAGLANGETGTIYLHKSRNDTFNGLNTFCKSNAITDTNHPNYYNPSGDFFGVALNVYREHQSLVVDNKGRPLDEMGVVNYMQKFQSAKGIYGMGLDSAVMRPEALTEFIRARRSREVLNRGVGSGTQQLSAQGLGISTKTQITFDGITVNGYLSNYMRAGDVFLLKMGDQNFKRYTPPRSRNMPGANIPGLEMDKVKTVEFESMGTKLGYSSEYVPIRDSNGNPVDGKMLLGRSRMAIVPDQFPMVKIENVSEGSIDLVTS